MIRLKVKEVAMQMGFNQASLARATGLGFSTIKRIFHDPYKTISLQMLEQIAKTLGVSAHDLFEEEPDPE
ncbi:XRE family transcriptional regulator [Ktedonosporobacter rubrisoli]|uniref:XRE family transcriptional regulator n=1 Tax=Ktedonosporobacter rubrisoli TaxID=2509675 RepID=A0A4V0Z096_KTERU|nr:helix-turn-helix transcriptional regulator [Ktedonosporobacter rubrisoli]QBD82451.1 XRE family transcriptional regulator [Ktedonosporobacter rubrisoli]